MSNDEQQNLATRWIRHARKATGMTQGEVSDRTGIPLRTYQAYERGENQPPDSSARKIREVLGVSEASKSYNPAPIAREHNVYEPPPVIEADLREVGRHVDYVVRDASGRIRLRVSFLIEASPSAHESRVEHS